jgi:D-tagatose-1,6-bisphosphate aldolase subunit GatZ/KbaZ
MDNLLWTMIRSRHEHALQGLYCACSANAVVIEACMEHAIVNKMPLIVEATANQVNQDGGYTGMVPQDFVVFVEQIANQCGFDLQQLILGGDHLGPLTWAKLPAEQAMAKARVLVELFVKAGFTKIHLDTSMHLGDDDQQVLLPTTVIAQRGIELMKVCEQAYQERLETNPQAIKPCYIIGSEVPIPGGAQEIEGMHITTYEDAYTTIETFRSMMEVYGLSEVWPRVVGLVVQPGVEFGDEAIHEYDPQLANHLPGLLKDYPNLVYEGHSTDYQSPVKLRQMVEHDIALLKVGPGLTFAYREGLFALAMIEEALFNGKIVTSQLIQVLEQVMVEQPESWYKHYHGDAHQLQLARKYSFSDRIRYYLPHPQVVAAINTLMYNFGDRPIPLTLLSQYLPIQYHQVRAGKLQNHALHLIKDVIRVTLDDYRYAIRKPETHNDNT